MRAIVKCSAHWAMAAELRAPPDIEKFLRPAVKNAGVTESHSHLLEMCVLEGSLRMDELSE
jgi:hypothetical protein